MAKAKVAAPATKGLNTALDTIKKSYGQGAVMYLGENSAMEIAVIPSGIMELDIKLGVGGVPRGRIIEIFGNESGGKSTLALHLVKEAQGIGLQTAYIDAEHALDPAYATSIGVDIDRLLIAQPDSGEEGLDICLQLCKSHEVGLIVVDSVAALTPRAEIAGDIGDAHVGLQARMMSQALRMIAGEANKSGTTVVFINQLREKIGVMFGNPETTPGGRALKFYSSVRISMTRLAESIGGKGNDSTGNKVRVNIIKNKVAPPFRTCDLDIEYGKGFSVAGSVLNVAVEHGLIAKSGAWYADVETGENIGQGYVAAKLHIEENPEYMEELMTLIMGGGDEV